MASDNRSFDRFWKGGVGGSAKLLDAGILLCVVAAACWMFDHNPHGWIATNPSPFFLVPLLMGGRYGPISGLLAGAVTAGVLVGCSALQSGHDIHEVIGHGRFVLLCLPLTGLVCGEIQSALFKDWARSGIQLDLAARRLRALDEQVFILAETKDELDRELALLNADTANMDYEIRRVLQSPPERFHDALLGVFCRKARLYEAAIYLAGSPWRRAAYSGSPEIWPELLDVGDSAVARVAVENATIATLPEVWESEPFPADDFLVACPIGESGGLSSMLLVRSMPFSSMNMRGMQIIEIICRWVSEFSVLNRKSEGLFDPRGIVPLEDFERMLALACKVQKKFRLVSSVVLFRPGAGSLASGDELAAAVKGAIRVGDTLSSLGGPVPHILLLLPLTGRRGAEICLARFREFAHGDHGGKMTIEGEIFCTDGFANESAMRSALDSAFVRPC